MEKLDLFSSLVRYLAIKPLKFAAFNLEEAKSVIKTENQCCITFIGKHGFMEKTLEEVIENVAKSDIKNGTVYIYIKGQGCSERIKRSIVELAMNVRRIIIFGDPEKWPIRDPRIKFVDPGEIFEDNHQRFFIFQSPAYNVALVARHVSRDGVEVIEAAMSNVAESVSFIAQSVGTKIYDQLA